MAKHNDSHLTTEQLSAFLDRNMPPEEQAVCEVHLQECAHCRSGLVGLRQTVSLLKALPQPELPRSFILPQGIRYLQERAEGEDSVQRESVQPVVADSTAREPRLLWLDRLRSTTRAVSMIAAVVGLIFLLSTGILGFHGGGAASMGTGSSSNTAGSLQNGTVHANSTVRGVAPQTRPSVPSSADKTRLPAAESSPQVVSKGHEQPVTLAGHNINTLPLPDISTGLGREEIGFFLLILGILGVLLTRRWGQRRL